MLDEQTCFELELRKDVHSALWKAAIEEARTHGSEAQTKRLSLLAHHHDSNELWSFALVRSAELTNEVVIKLRDEILQEVTPEQEGNQ